MDSVRDFSEISKVEKPTIDYARFARIVKFNKKYFFLQFLVLVFTFEVVIFLLSERYFYLVANLGKELYGGTVSSYRFLWWILSYTVVSGKFPTVEESTSYFVMSLVLFIFLLSRFNPLPKPITAWFIYIDFVYMVSSAYFILSLESFPYTIKEFGKLYVILQFGIFLLIPWILGMSLSIFSFSPINLAINFTTILITLSYSALLGWVRYLAFILILQKFSYIHMAVMFFVFGPLMDFIYISSLYSLAVYVTIKLYFKRGRAPFTWVWEH